MINNIPKGSTISIPVSLRPEWATHSYFYRHAHISLDYKLPFDYNFLLIRNDTKNEIPNYYTKLKLNLKQYSLYKKQ